MRPSPRSPVRASLRTLLRRTAVLWLVVGAADARAAVLADDWYTTTILGKRVGYMHELRESVTENGVDLVRTTMETEFTFLRMGTELNVRSKALYTETADGEAIRFESHNHLAKNDYLIKAERQGDMFVVTQESMGKKTQADIPYTDDILFPYALDRAIRARAMTPGTRLLLKTFSPDLARPTRITIVAKGWETDGADRLLRFESEQELVPGVVLHEWRKANGDIVKTMLPLVGIEVVSSRSSRADALLGAESVELLVSTLVHPADVIPQARRVSRTRLRLSYRDSKRDAGDIAVSEDERQRVVKRSPAGTEVEIRSETWAKNGQAPAPGRNYRIASSALQIDDPEVKALALRATPQDSYETMAKSINAWVHKAIAKKSLAVGLATAAEVARDLTGDCTEHAVLAAALARARRVPSKVSMGLVYVDGAFGYHMWTEVFDAGWHGIDPALGQDAIDATHIKLADSALDTGLIDGAMVGLVQLIANLEVKVLEYDLDGKTYQGGAAHNAGSYNSGKFKHPLFGIQLEAPTGWRLGPPVRGADKSEILSLTGPGGATGVLSATTVSYDFSLLRWLGEHLPEFKIARETPITIDNRAGHRFVLEGEPRAALLAFFDRDTLFTLKISPFGREAELTLSGLVQSIRLEN